MFKKFEQELLKEDWHTIRDGIEVKLCKLPKEVTFAEVEEEVTETFIFCRSRDRKLKDQAIAGKVADRIVARLEAMKGRAETDISNFE